MTCAWEFSQQKRPIDFSKKKVQVFAQSSRAVLSIACKISKHAELIPHRSIVCTKWLEHRLSRNFITNCFRSKTITVWMCIDCWSNCSILLKICYAFGASARVHSNGIIIIGLRCSNWWLDENCDVNSESDTQNSFNTYSHLLFASSLPTYFT